MSSARRNHGVTIAHKKNHATNGVRVNTARILRARGTDERARVCAWFFKTGKGEYAEGDVFVGVRVPDLRTLARSCDFSLPELATLLASEVHESRFLALVLLVHFYEKGDRKEQKRVVRFYLAHRARINNWDLVDISAPRILGAEVLATGDDRILFTLAHRKSVWERRLAMVATFALIRAGDFSHTLALASLLCDDSHDLIQKATGWMLREVGKKDEQALRDFLKKEGARMARTAFRYATERIVFDKKDLRPLT
jgi:3-methyladenine DNA glycosylase AlkD